MYSGEGSINNEEEILSALYKSTLSKLQASNVDLEVKEGAITCMACIITHAGHK